MLTKKFLNKIIALHKAIGAHKQHPYHVFGLDNVFNEKQTGLLAPVITIWSWARELVVKATYQGHHATQVQRGLKLGFLLFLLSEAMLFFSFFMLAGFSGQKENSTPTEQKSEEYDPRAEWEGSWSEPEQIELSVERNENGSKITSIKIHAKDFGDPGDRFVFDLNRQVALRYRRLEKNCCRQP